MKKFILNNGIAPNRWIGNRGWKKAGCWTKARYGKDQQQEVGNGLNFDGAYKNRGSCQLGKSYAVLKSCSNPLILGLGPKIMEDMPQIAVPFSKHTYYEYFVGGPGAMDCEAAVKDLWSEGMRVVLDYSVESQQNEGSSQKIAEEVENSVRVSAQFNEKYKMDVCKFGVVKVTGIVNINSLGKLNQIIEAACKDEKYVEYIPKCLRIDGYKLADDRPVSMPSSTPVEKLSPEDEESIERLIGRMESLVRTCDESGLPLLIDAEHTYYQAAIDYLAMYLQMEFTKANQRPIIFNTYQMYLEDSLPRLKHDMDWMHKQGFKFGAKLVRGAYIPHESDRCRELGLPIPFNKSKPLTDECYNNGVFHCLDNIDECEVFIATHNQETLDLTTKRMNEMGFDRNDQRITFAQLYGMGDSLSLALTQSGYVCAKYVPYGPVSEVMPYLTRRIQENGSMLGGNAVEVRRIAQELGSRMPWSSRR